MLMQRCALALVSSLLVLPTSFEGGRLTLEQAAGVIADEGADIAGMEKMSQTCKITARLNRRRKGVGQDEPSPHRDSNRPLHSLAMTGKPSRPTSLRKRKIAVKSPLTGDPVYLPPRSENLPELMAALEIWTEDARSSDLPVPEVAGLVHYQLAAIQPFND